VTKAAFRVNFEELAGSQEVDFSAVLRRMEEAAGIAGGSPGADCTLSADLWLLDPHLIRKVRMPASVCVASNGRVLSTILGTN
jgi:hypothetical protein